MSTSTTRVLIIEDERKMREALAKALRLEGWHAAECVGGKQAISLMGRERFELVLLDWMLPDVDGLELLKEIRTLDAKIAVLMLTARGSVDDRVRGLNGGADDYLPKPFSLVELITRCRALLRRANAVSAPKIRCGDLCLDVPGRTARRGPEEIALTPQEIDVLECLAEHQGQVVTREMLERAVWGEVRPDGSRDNLLDVLILRIRQKIEPPGSTKIIHTLRGSGFRLADQPT